jgi:hypothetical protein
MGSTDKCFVESSKPKFSLSLKLSPLAIHIFTNIRIYLIMGVMQCSRLKHNPTCVQCWHITPILVFTTTLPVFSNSSWRSSSNGYSGVPCSDAHIGIPWSIWHIWIPLFQYATTCDLWDLAYFETLYHKLYNCREMVVRGIGF